MGKIVAVIWIGAILFGGFWFGYYQEGANSDLVVEFRLKGRIPNSPVQPSDGILYATRDKLALVMKGDGGGQSQSGKIIVDMADKEISIVADAQKIVITVPIELVDKSECKAPEALATPFGDDLERLPDTRIIAGHRCHGFKLKKSTDAQGVLWFTYDVRLGRDYTGFINKLLRLGKVEGSARTPKNGKRAQVSSFTYFPIPLLLDVRSREGSFRFEVTSIKREKVDKDIFDIPSDYNEMKLKDILKGFGGTGGG